MTLQAGAADYGLVFEDPPPALRVADAAPRQTERYIAPDSHRPHGTRVKYVVEKCRCEPCCLDNRAKERERQRAMSRPDEAWCPYVPAGRARAHVAELRQQGVGLKTIAKVGGIPHGGLSKLMYGDRARKLAPSKRIRPTTEARILAVSLAKVNTASKIPAGPTWALLDNLIARGFTKSWIAQQLGAKGPGLQIKRTLVRATTARKVEALHRGLAGVEAPPRRSRWST